jgi:tryptophan-rich sensory protein
MGIGNVAWSDIAFAVAPIVVGLGSAALLVSQKKNTKGLKCAKRPPLQPPGWVFMVVWPILYLLMGVASALAWRAGGRKWSLPLITFVIATVLLMAWWVVFANVCAPVLATAALVVLTLVWVWITFLFWRASPLAAYLLMPLLVWLSFASYLTSTTI